MDIIQLLNQVASSNEQW